MTLKTHHLLDCDCLEQIQQEALHWISTNTLLLESSDDFWNKIDYKHFIKQNKTLVNWCLAHNFKIREVAVLVAHSKEGVPLHTDELPVIAKINFPILNTKDTYTEWCVNDSVIDKVETLTPMVFNSNIPHRVVIGDTAQIPRVQISCMLYNEPIEYLK